MTKEMAFYLLTNKSVYLTDEGKRYLKQLLEDHTLQEVKNN